MRRRDAIRMAVLAVLFGSGYLWVKIADRAFTPIQIAFVQVAVGTLILFFGIVVRRAQAGVPRQVLRHLIVMAFFSNAAPSLLVNWAEKTVSSGLGGVANATTPLFVLILSFSLRLEKISMLRMSGLVAGFSGVVVLGAPWENSAHGDIWVPLGALLAAAASYGVGYTYAQRYLMGHGIASRMLAAWQLAFASIALGVTAIISGGSWRFSGEPVIAVVALGVLSTGLAYALNYRLIAELGAVVTSSVTYLIPVASVILGSIFLSERLSWHFVVGACIILLGVAISENRLERLWSRPCSWRYFRYGGLHRGAGARTDDRPCTPGPASRAEDRYGKHVPSHYGGKEDPSGPGPADGLPNRF